MSAACQFADILEKEKEQRSGSVLCIADYKLKHDKADEEVSGATKIQDVFNENSQSAWGNKTKLFKKLGGIEP